MAWYYWYYLNQSRRSLSKLLSFYFSPRDKKDKSYSNFKFEHNTVAWCYWYYLNQSREVTQQACFQLSFLSFGEKQATAIITSLTLIGTLPTFSSSAISKGIIIFQLFNFSISLLLADSLAQRGADILPNIKMKRILRRRFSMSCFSKMNDLYHYGNYLEV